MLLLRSNALGQCAAKPISFLLPTQHFGAAMDRNKFHTSVPLPQYQHPAAN